MRYSSAYQSSVAMLRGPRARSRSVLAANNRHTPPQRRNMGKTPVAPSLIDQSHNVHVVYHAVPVSRLAG